MPSLKKKHGDAEIVFLFVALPSVSLINERKYLINKKKKKKKKKNKKCVDE